MSKALFGLVIFKTKIEKKSMISQRLKTKMHLSPAIAFLAMVGAPAVMAQTGPAFDVSCRGAEDIRQILVVAPGEVGAACDVIYTRDRGLTATTPYYANSDVNFCINKAVGLRDKLRSANYECSGVGNARTATFSPARVTAPAASAPVQQAPIVKNNVVEENGEDAFKNAAPLKAAADSDSPLSDRDSFLRKLKSADDEEPSTQTNLKTEATLREVPTSIANSKILVPEETLKIPSVPAPTGLASEDILVRNQTAIANAGPVRLITPAVGTTNSKSENVILPSQPRAEVASKLVGATPVVLANVQESAVLAKPVRVPETAVAKTGNSLSLSQTPVSEKVSASTASGGIFSSVVSAVNADKPRSRPEIIRATLAAQAAAWNEGDIEAFMEGYWRSPDLRFVSGVDVSKGWNNTLKRYKNRYGNGAALGQLMFERLDVQMVTEEVAIVVGRFVLDRTEGQSSGTFSLVMKRFEGAWRIVHDHTVADAEKVKEVAAQE